VPPCKVSANLTNIQPLRVVSLNELARKGPATIRYCSDRPRLRPQKGSRIDVERWKLGPSHCQRSLCHKQGEMSGRGVGFSSYAFA
jgi:hypothetical protein